ncbi:MAG: hypothetical protein JEZ14_09570 [Marinilabiliaceae bacterium]|nr:hypothetical protein [Marinilabiliaceae bacterium]
MNKTVAYIGILILNLITGFNVFGQDVPDTHQQIELGHQANTFIEGYASDNGSGHFQYHSLFGAVTPSLLVRSESPAIQWKSAPIPLEHKEKFVEFMWLASADAGDSNPEFKLYINKLKRFSFSQDEPQSWEQKGEEGSVLNYIHVKSDQHGDTHGYMHLKIPAKWVTRGNPVNFILEGNQQGGNTWVQVYRQKNVCDYLYNKSSKEIWTKLSLKNNQIQITASANQAKQNVLLKIGDSEFHAQLDATAKTIINSKNLAYLKGAWSIQFENGTHFSGMNFNQPEQFYALSHEGTINHINATNEGNKWTLQAQSIYQPEMVKKVIELSASSLANGTICLMNSSHQDIAWMDDVEKCILERDTMLITPMIKEGLAKTEYSFDIEDALMIEEYLHRHPERKEDIISLIDQGKITVGATYIQPYEEMYSGESLARQFYHGKKWLKQELNGYEADTYWNVDVPGRSLQMPQLMAKAGVENLIISRHAKGVFQWKSPDGSSVNTYSSGHYSLDYNGLNRDFLDASAHIAEAALFWKEGYNDVDPAKTVMPILSDWDMSPAKDYSELIDKWHLIKYVENEKHQLSPIQLPNIELTSTSDFIDRIASNSKALNVIQGERPALWLYIHGPSHQKAIKASREGDRSLVNAEKFSVFDALTRGSFADYPDQQLNEAWKSKIYPDHGWGGKNGDITDAIFEAKYQEALQTGQNLTEKALSNIAQRIKTKKKGKPIVLFNGLNWKRTAPVQIQMNFEPGETAGIMLQDSKGKDVPIQITSSDYYASGSLKSATFEILAVVPAMGYTTYYMMPAEKKIESQIPILSKHIETTYYKIQLQNGGIQSILDKSSGQELIDAKNLLAGEVFTMQSEGNGAGEFVQVQQPSFEEFDKVSNHQPKWETVADGAVFSELKLKQPLKHAIIEVKLKVYKQLPQINFNVEVLNWDGELYREFRVAFPVASQLNQVAYEVPFGILRVGQDEMEGAAGGEAGGMIYDTPCEAIHPRGIANWIGAYNDKVAMVVSSSVVAADYLDIYEKDKINLQPILLASRHSCHWEGNPYPQTGNHHFEFSLSTTSNGLTEANRIGIANNEPIMVVVKPEQIKHASLPEKLSFMHNQDKNAIVSTIKKAEDSDRVIIRLYNTTNESLDTKLEFYRNINAARKTNLIEEPMENIPTQQKSVSLPLTKFEIETIELDL